MQLIAPTLMGAAALVVLPWLIHHIRRPEREPIRFSSLMFLPDIKKEVIERRKVQHILLMLLRMLLFVLLAIAFSRPFLPERKAFVGESDAPARHMILVDVSYSMNMGNRFAEARRIVSDILDEIPDDVPVGLIAFDERSETRAPLDGEPATTHILARNAISELEPGQGGTRYQAALQHAESLLLEGLDTGETTPAVLHMVSDFSRRGMPTGDPDWRLSGRIVFRGYPVSTELERNLSLMELGKRDEDGRLVVAGKVKNWSFEREETTTVELLLGDEPAGRQEVVVAPGGASQVRFSVPFPEGEVRGGRLVLADDDFALDNERYFVWRAPEKKTILLVAEPDDTRWPADWFVSKALAATERPPWQIVGLRPSELPGALSREPAAVLIIGTRAMTPAATAALHTYLRDGGQALITLDNDTAADRSRALLEPFGLRLSETVAGSDDARRASLVGWMDFDHPAQLVFRGTRFNDFSAIRFTRFRDLEPIDGASVRVLARTDSREGVHDGSPLISEVGLGDGRALVWSFSPELSWTNLPKTAKFVPLLLETVRYLGKFDQTARTYEVGGTYALRADSPLTVRFPDGRERDLDVTGAPVRIDLQHAGLLQRREGGTWTPFEAVNLPGGESDPETIQIDEFALRLTANGGEAIGASHEGVARYEGEFEERRELGFFLIPLLAAFLLVETLYAARLSTRRKAGGPGDGEV